MANPENIQNQLKQIAALIKSNQLKEAQLLLQSVITHHPDNADVWYLASHASKDPEQQLKTLQRALRLKPDHPQAKARLAKLASQTPPITVEPPRVKATSARPIQQPAPKAQTSNSKYYWVATLVLVGVIGISLVLIVGRLPKTPPSVALNKPTQLVTDTLALHPTTPSGTASTDIALLVTDTPQQQPTTPSGTASTDIALLVTDTPQQQPTTPPKPTSTDSALLVADTPRSQGERIVFFDGDSMFLIKPDGTEQTFVDQNSDFSFRNTDPEVKQFIWSPDVEKHQFTFTWGTDTLVFDPFTQSRFLLGAGSHVSWSPDGQQAVIAWRRSYINGESYLVIVNADGSNPQSITSTETYSYNPEWSPDGQLIAFVRSEDNKDVIYTIKPDGSDETRLTNGANPRWSPDSQTLLFYREERAIEGNLYRIKPDGSDEIKIAPTVGLYQEEIAYRWSPDGQKIALLAPQSGRDTKLFVTTPDGSEILWEYNLSMTSGIMNYVWAPDSTRLLVLNEGSFIIIDIITGNAQLLLAKRDNGSNDRFGTLGSSFAWLTEEQTAGALQALETAQVANEEQQQAQPYYFIDAINLNPVSLLRFDGQSLEHLESSVAGSEIQQNSGFSSWSPDGTQIVFDSITYPARTWSLYTMDVDGSNLRQIAPLGFRPVWSPDGRRIGFLSYVEEIGENSLNPDDKVGYLYVMDPDGQNTIQISDQAVSDWSWSPDGYSIAYSHEGKVTAVRSDGKNPRVIAENGFTPAWSPNSLYIAFAGTDRANSCICFVPSDGSAPPMSIGQGSDPAWSPDGMQITFLRDDGLYVMDADGSDVRLVTSSQAEKYAPLWSPDGMYIGYWEDRLSEEFYIGPYIFRLIRPDGTGIQTIPVPASFEEYEAPYRMQWAPADLYNHVDSFVLQDTASTPVPTVAPLATIRLQPTLTLTPSPFPPGFETLVPTPIGGTDLGGGNGKILFYEGNAGNGKYYEFDLTTRSKVAVPLPSYVYNIIPHPNGLYFVARQQYQNALRPILINKADLTISPISNIEVRSDIALSPDGSQIAYAVEDPDTQVAQIWVANLDGTNIRRITDTAVIEVDDPSTEWRPGDPAWSPDGQRIAYSYAGKLRVVDLATLNDEVLVENGHRIVWSPDGQHIAYFISGGRGLSISIWSEEDEDPLAPNVYIADVDGSNAYPIGNGKYENLAWSPDGEHLVLSQNGNIYNINRDGTELNLMLGRSDQYVGNLVWETRSDASQSPISPLLVSPTPTPGPSPTLSFGGGTGKIFYSFGGGSIYYELDLQTLNTTLIQFPGVIQAVLHPDPQYLVGVYKRNIITEGRSEDLFNPVVINRADGTIFPIPNITEGHDIALSPDGAQFAYVVGDPNTQIPQLWIATLDGTNIRRISDPAIYVSEPVWSPDGTRIAYVARSEEMTIHVIDVASLADQVLVENGKSPAWSPNNQQIAYTVPQDNQSMPLYIMNADGSNPRHINTGVGQVFSPAWSPDGLQLIFSGYNNIYMVNADGTGFKQILSGNFSSDFIWETLPNSQAAYPTLPPPVTVTPTPTYALSLGGGSGKILVQQDRDASTQYEFNLTTHVKTEIKLPFSIIQVALYPDGQYFIGTYEETIWDDNPHDIHKPVLINKGDLSLSFIPNIEQGYNVAASPDGSQIAYLVEDTSTHNDRVWAANIDGTNARPISDSSVLFWRPIEYLWIDQPAWSPDGTRVAYIAESQIRIVDLATLTDRVLVESGVSPDWSPDGSRIVYASPTGISIVNADGTNNHLITADYGTDPTWSPDGSHVLFGRKENVYMVEAEGSEPIPVMRVFSQASNLRWLSQSDPSLPTMTPRPTLPATPTLTPTATFSVGGGTGKILFNEGDNYRASYHELDLQTGTETWIPLPDSIIQAIPHPDGQSYVGVYREQLPTGSQSDDIVKPVLINKTDLSISPIPNIDQGRDIALSPDGSKIAYITNNRNHSKGQLWMVNLDGTNLQALTEPPPIDPEANLFLSDPMWSPDGLRIVYVANLKIHILDVTTLSNQVILESAHSPSWSPDGSQIAYVSIVDSYTQSVYIANADGSNPHSLTTPEDINVDPSWSPDGSRIVFGLLYDGIYTVKLDGTELTRVMEYSAGMFGFTWEAPLDPSRPTPTPRPALPLLTTFTPTPTLTPSPTATAWYIFTPTPAALTQGPTPTPAELRINSKEPARAFVQMTSSNPDAILFQGSTLTENGLSLEGFAEIGYGNNGGVNIVVHPGESASSWEFRFYAPDMQVGPTYRTDEGPAFNEASITRVFVRPSGIDMATCSSAVGEFRIEAVEPHLVISFTHACNGDPTQEIRGLIVFKPAD